MKLKESSPSKLTNRYEKACARLARLARGNTYFGGASALVIAKRCKYKKFPAMEIVSDVYGASNGSLGEWGAYECPECGQTYLGTEAALNCCSREEIWAEVLEEE